MPLLGDSSNIGVRILLHNKRRFIVSAMGIAVAVVIMFLEAGFFFGVLDSQANLATLIRGDLVVLHRFRTHLNKWHGLEKIRLHQIHAIDGVAAVLPIYKATMRLKNPDTDRSKRIVVYAFRPNDHPLAIGNLDEISAQLRLSRTILFDRRSRKIYGDLKVGQELTLDRRIFRIGGFVDIGPNIVNDGAVVMSEGNWRELEPNDKPIMGVIRLKPGADIAQVQQRIIQMQPEDVSVLTPAALREREVTFTAKAAPIGIIFGIGLLAGLVIGTITCYQVLFNEIADQTQQFAMLKAIGFSNRFVGRIILTQALVLSIVGFFMALAVSAAIYDYVADEAALIMQHSWPRVLSLMALTVTMCIGAGFIAMRRTAFKDPAEMF